MPWVLLESQSDYISHQPITFHFRVIMSSGIFSISSAYGRKENRNWRFRLWIWIHVCKICTERTLYIKQIEETNSWRPTHALTKLWRSNLTLNNHNWRVNHLNVNSVCSWCCNNSLGSSFPPVTERIFAAPFVTWSQSHWTLILEE